MLLLPSAVLILLFKFYPMLNTLMLSFQESTLLSRNVDKYIGFKHYLDLILHDKVFQKAFINSLVWVFWNVLIQTVLGMGMALILTRKFRGRGLYRALSFTPWAVSGLLVSLMWSFMYNQNVGVINDVLMKLGILNRRISWFATGDKAMLSLIIASTWRGLPFFIISILASLQTIPDEIYESCKMDGANGIRSFFSITLPMIKDSLVLTILLRAIWTLNSADMIYSMTGGGPNYGTTTVPVLIMNTFQGSLDFGKTSAMSMIMCLFMVLVSLLYLRVTRYGKESLY